MWNCFPPLWSMFENCVGRFLFFFVFVSGIKNLIENYQRLCETCSNMFLCEILIKFYFIIICLLTSDYLYYLLEILKCFCCNLGTLIFIRVVGFKLLAFEVAKQIFILCLVFLGREQWCDWRKTKGMEKRLMYSNGNGYNWIVH